MTTSLPGYAEIDSALTRFGAEGDAAQAHGALTGLLCARPDASVPEWLAEALGVDDQAASDAPQRAQVLDELRSRTLEQLADTELGFELLLPPEGSDLPTRAAALGRWCQGFLHGLGLGGVSDEAELDDEVREYLRDLGEIARVEAGGDEEDERAYAEVVEYVRMGAILTCLELRQEAPSPRLQ